MSNLNRHHLFYLVLFISLIIPGSLVLAQDPNVFRLGFRQDFNNYVWDGRFLYSSSGQAKYQLRVSESYRTNLLTTSSQTDKWKDDNQFRLDYLYPFQSWLQGGFLLESTIYSDRQSGFFNNYNTHALNFGFAAIPTSTLLIKSYLGIKSDERYEKRDQGLHYQIQSLTQPFLVSDYRNQFQLDFRGDEFRGRKDQDLAIRYDVKREFYHNTFDSLAFQFGYRKKVYFISQQGDLESRLERDNQLTNLLNYQINDNLSWRLFTQLFSRSSSVDQIIEQNSTGSRERRDTGILWQSSLDWQGSRHQTRLAYLYNSLHQKFQTSKSIKISPTIGSLGIPDNDNISSSLRFSNSLKVSGKDSLLTRLFISRFQYDTPDSSNFDDRDEFRATAMIGLLHIFSPSFKIGLELSTNIHHLVYIFKEKSANNNWNRILQMGTKLSYSPNPEFLWKQRAQVLANYTNYDFEQGQTQIRSFVFRKFTLTDSLLLGSFGGLQIQFFHRLELEENGRLFWHNFSEELMLNRQNHFLTLGFQFPLLGDLILYNGISAYFRREWRYRHNLSGPSNKEKRRDFISYGPQFKLFLINKSQQNAFVSVSRFKVKTANEQTYFINQIDLRATWFF